MLPGTFALLAVLRHMYAHIHLGGEDLVHHFPHVSDVKSKKTVEDHCPASNEKLGNGTGNEASELVTAVGL